MTKSKRIIFILAIAILGIFQISNSQTPSWKWVKWSQGTETTARSACIDASGNMYTTGFFKTTTTFDTFNLKANWSAVFITKFSATGTVIWAKIIDNPGYLDIDSKCIAMDGSGNIYVSGTYTGTIKMDAKTLTGGGHFLAKYDNNGVSQWIVNASASNALLANSSGAFVAGGKIIQKFDGAGSAGWTITGAPSNTGYTNFFSAAFNSGGNIVLAGDISDNWTFGTVSITGGYQNVVLMEISTAGTVSWAKVYGNGIGSCHAQSIAVDGSDNIIITGKVGGLTTATCTFGTLSLPAKNAYLVKLNSTGITQWGTVMTNAGDISGSGVAVTTDAAGAMYVTAGTTDNLASTNGSTTTFVSAMKGTNAFILKFNAAGIFQSALTNKELSSPYINACGGLVLASSPAGVYFAGRAGPYSEWGTLKATSSYGSVFAKIDGNSPGGIRFDDANSTISVYPNPSKAVFALDLHNIFSSIKNANLSIVNISGETIYQTEINDQLLTINLEGYPSGIYFLKVTTSEGIITKKILNQ